MWFKLIYSELLVQLDTSNSNTVLEEVSFGVTHSDHLEKLYSKELHNLQAYSSPNNIQGIEQRKRNGRSMWGAQKCIFGFEGKP
jgi:hypothetical protein